MKTVKCNFCGWFGRALGIPTSNGVSAPFCQRCGINNQLEEVEMKNDETMLDEIIDNGPGSNYWVGKAGRSLSKNDRTSMVFVSQKYPDLFWKDRRECPADVDVYTRADRPDPELAAVREAINANLLTLKAAYADVGAADKIINSGHSDRMAMEVTKQRLAVLINMNENALAILDRKIGGA